MSKSLWTICYINEMVVFLSSILKPVVEHPLPRSACLLSFALHVSREATLVTRFGGAPSAKFADRGLPSIFKLIVIGLNALILIDISFCIILYLNETIAHKECIRVSPRMHLSEIPFFLNPIIC